MTAADEIASDALRTGRPSAVTRPAAIAAWARARLSNRPRATNRRSARSRTVMTGDYKRDARHCAGHQTSANPKRCAGSGSNELDRLAAHILAERFKTFDAHALGRE